MDIIYYIFVVLGGVLVAAAGLLLFREFSNVAITFIGLILMTFGVILFMLVLGIDPHRKDAPPKVEKIARGDFPGLFDQLDTICDRLAVPRWNSVSICVSRMIAITPHGRKGSRTEWVLEIGTAYLTEASIEEFEREMAVLTALHYSENCEPYRAITERMQRRAMLVGQSPLLASLYWKAWAIANVLFSLPDSKVLNEVNAISDPRLSGSMAYRVFAGTFISDPLLIENSNQWQLTHADVPGTYSELVDELGLLKMTYRQDIVDSIVQCCTEKNPSFMAYYLPYFERSGLSSEQIVNGALGDLATILSQQVGESAFKKLIGNSTNGSRIISQIIREEIGWKWKLSRADSLSGQRVLKKKGEGPDGLTAEECLAIFNLITAERGCSAAILYGIEALKVHPTDLVLTYETAQLLYRCQPLHFLEFVSQMRRVRSLGLTTNTLIGAWKASFCSSDTDWSLPATEYDASKHNEYLEANMRHTLKEFWIEQARTKAEVSGLIACKSVDQAGNEKQLVVAVVKSQSRKLRPSWFHHEIQSSFESDDISTLLTYDANSVFVKKMDPEFFIYRS